MPDAMKPDIHGVGTPWILGFIAVMSYAAGSSSSGMNAASTP
jgi:hypothetical protein